ncbi:transcriptional regulator [Aliidongia dinghuensis]|uniref:Transcriptional regulator n=1 Tax=Aliidongia dinghuensis TaxID=1867774 RepID=A0A8J3E4E6_9PROT|nr:IclR family transcriptional regulator [Aliidongia dinghuensis]GGF26650.1 transcriptional regulator [Aliidongia dinghuensis]
MPRVTGSSGEGVQAVVLALRILERLAEEGRPMGVTALAAALGTTKSRIWRYLQTLVQQGYIVQLPDTERYQLGARLVKFGRAVGESLDIVSASYHAIRELRDSLGHSAVITQIEPDGVRVLTTVPGRSTIEIGVKQGSLMEFHSSAQGKIALAFGSETLRAAVLSRRLERRTPDTIVSPSSLRKEIERVRRDGWAIAPNEIVTGLNALAAPVFDAAGSLVGALAIVDSVQFITATPTAEQIERTVEAARQVSAALGYLLD